MHRRAFHAASCLARRNVRSRNEARKAFHQTNSSSWQRSTSQLLSRKLTSTASAKKSETKTPGDLFLDNLGTIFLSAIGCLILTLVRSSQGTSNKNELRKQVESTAALDPFEIDDLRVANSQFTPSIFKIIHTKLKDTYGWNSSDKINYKDFVSAVIQIMRSMKGDAFTIELGHLIDRVMSSVAEDKDAHWAVDEEGNIVFGLLLAALSLAINGSTRERVELLFDVLKEDSSWVDGGGEISSTSKGVKEDDIIAMVGYLQKTCQLTPDAQIIESSVKYPVQEYKVASPFEMVLMGKELKKDVLSDQSLGGDDVKGEWSCDDFHHLLRSRSVCAWGECYVKKKSL